MTHPSDIAGLSERLRAVRKQIAFHIGKNWLGIIDEAAIRRLASGPEGGSVEIEEK